MDLTDWEKPDPALVAVPGSDADWDALFARYFGTVNDLPLRRCLAVARAHGAKSVVIETRYVDLDYRSEFHALYGRMHADVPAYAHRIHFFGGEIRDSHLGSLPPDHAYIGYISVRPVSAGVVSRAMLPPPRDAPTVRCAVREGVGFFGEQLVVEGVPFSQQDTSLGACAHAAAWVCHYSGHLRGDVSRRPRAEIALQADPSLTPERALPSNGLNVQQLSDVLRRFDLPAIFYVMGSLPSTRLPWQPPDPTPPTPDALGGTWDDRVFAVMCRHLNGGYPILVGTYNHAFVVIGWEWHPTDQDRVIFVRHDDQRGPYLPVADPLADAGTYADGTKFDYGPWRTLQVPLPPKLWLAPEAAERKAGELLVAVSPQLKPNLLKHFALTVESLDELVAAGSLALRTYAVGSEAFKESLPALNIDAPHTTAYRRARLPRHLWVVEAIDTRLRDSGQPCVVGEALVDSTSADINPEIVAYRVHGVLVIQSPDRTTYGPFMGSAAPTRSGGQGGP